MKSNDPNKLPHVMTINFSTQTMRRATKKEIAKYRREYKTIRCVAKPKRGQLLPLGLP